MNSRHKYDLVVIGSGPAGQRAAVQAAKLKKRVAIVERDELGGSCIHTGTIPSKTLREAILYLTGYHQRAFYGQGYRLKPDVDMADLTQRVNQVVEHERGVVALQLTRNHIEIIRGAARFTGPHSVAVSVPGGERLDLEAGHILLATGSRPPRPPDIVFDGRVVLDSDQLLSLPTLPRRLVVVGGGVIGVEYASMLSALDMEITLIDGRDRLLEFVDGEIVAELTHHMRVNGVVLRLGERVDRLDELSGSGGTVILQSGRRVACDAVLFAAGRRSNVEGLDLEAAGVEADERGRIRVNANYQTNVAHIYAAGDVIGFPALAASSMHQGRAAAYHAFKQAPLAYNEYLPFGIYGVPSISMIGRTEQELTRDKVPYEVGIARFRESARGQILGLEDGLLKLLFSIRDRRLLGAHIIGEGATELVHIGQAVMALGGDLDYFLHTVFNYPTLAGTYKIAALDAYNKLGEQLP